MSVSLLVYPQLCCNGKKNPRQSDTYLARMKKDDMPRKYIASDIARKF
jgi:hypothetical protein